MPPSQSRQRPTSRAPCTGRPVRFLGTSRRWSSTCSSTGPASTPSSQAWAGVSPNPTAGSRDDDVAFDAVGGEPPLAHQGGLEARRPQPGKGGVHADAGTGGQTRAAAHHRAHDAGGQLPSGAHRRPERPPGGEEDRGPEAPRTLGYREGHEFHGSDSSCDPTTRAGDPSLPPGRHRAGQRARLRRGPGGPAARPRPGRHRSPPPVPRSSPILIDAFAPAPVRHRVLGWAGLLGPAGPGRPCRPARGARTPDRRDQRVPRGRPGGRVGVAGTVGASRRDRRLAPVAVRGRTGRGRSGRRSAAPALRADLPVQRSLRHAVDGAGDGRHLPDRRGRRRGVRAQRAVTGGVRAGPQDPAATGRSPVDRPDAWAPRHCGSGTGGTCSPPSRGFGPRSATSCWATWPRACRVSTSGSTGRWPSTSGGSGR